MWFHAAESYIKDDFWVSSIKKFLLIQPTTILIIYISKQSLDVLYVDNTFEEVGNEFPIREQAMQEVLAIVRYAINFVIVM